MATARLSEKVILITGAAGGIGRATALAVGQAGASVVAVDRDQIGLDETLSQLEVAGVDATGLNADVSVVADVERYVAHALSAYGRIDGFFNNAGVEGEVEPLAGLAPEAFDRVIAVNLRGMFLGLRFVLPHMLERGTGAIVCTGSLASERGLPLTVAYNAAKHGVMGLVRTAAAEAGSRGVRVNGVLPGMIDTRMAHALSRRLAPKAQTVDSVASVGAAASALRRTGLPEEVADVVTFLLSDDARYITGVGLPVDGGALTMLGQSGDWPGL